MFLKLAKLIELANQYDLDENVKKANAIDDKIERVSSFLKDYKNLDLPSDVRRKIISSKIIFDRVNNFKTTIAGINPLTETKFSGSKYNIKLHEWLLDPTSDDGQEFEKFQLAALKLRANGIEINHEELGDEHYESSLASVSQEDAKEILSKLDFEDDEPKKTVNKTVSNLRNSFPGMPYSSYANLMGSTIYGGDFSNNEFSGVDESILMDELVNRSEGVILSAGRAAGKGKNKEIQNEMVSIARNSFVNMLQEWKLKGNEKFNDQYDKSLTNNDFTLIPSQLSSYLKYKTRGDYKKQSGDKFFTQHSPLERDLFDNQDYFITLLQRQLDETSSMLNTDISDPRVYEYVVNNWDFSSVENSPFYSKDLSEVNTFDDVEEMDFLEDFFQSQEDGYVQETDYGNMSQYGKNRLRMWFDAPRGFLSDIEDIRKQELSKKKRGEEYNKWIADSDPSTVVGEFKNMGMLYKFALYKVKLNEKSNLKNKYNALASLTDKAIHEGKNYFPLTESAKDAFNSLFPDLQMGMDKNTGEVSLLDSKKKDLKQYKENRVNALRYIADLKDFDNDNSGRIAFLRDELSKTTDEGHKESIEKQILHLQKLSSESGLGSLKEYAAMTAFNIAVKQKAIQKVEDEGFLSSDDENKTRAALENLSGDPNYQETIERQQEAGNLDNEISLFNNQDGLDDELNAKKQNVLLNSFILNFIEENGNDFNHNNLSSKVNLYISNPFERQKWFDIIKNIYKDYRDRQEMDSHELNSSQSKLLEAQFIDYLENKNDFDANIERIEIVSPYLPEQQAIPEKGISYKKMHPGKSIIHYEGTDYTEEISSTPEWYHFSKLNKTVDEIDPDGDDDTVVNSDGRFAKRISIDDARKAKQWIDENKNKIIKESEDIHFDVLQEYSEQQDRREFAEQPALSYLKEIMYDDSFWSSVRDKIRNSDIKELKKRFGIQGGFSSKDLTDNKIQAVKLLGYLHYGLGIPKKALGMLTYNVKHYQVLRFFENLMKIYNQEGFEGSTNIGESELSEVMSAKSSKVLNERFEGFSNKRGDIDVAINLASDYAKSFMGAGRSGINNYLKKSGMDKSEFESWYLMGLNNTLKSIEMGAVGVNTFYMGYKDSADDNLSQMLGDYSQIDEKITQQMSALDKDYFDNKKFIMKTSKGEDRESRLMELNKDYETALNNLFVSNQFDLEDHMRPFFERTRAASEVDIKSLSHVDKINGKAIELGEEIDISYEPVNSSNAKEMMLDYVSKLPEKLNSGVFPQNSIDNFSKLNEEYVQKLSKEEDVDPYKPVLDMNMPISHSVNRHSYYQKLLEEEKSLEIVFLQQLPAEEKKRLLEMSDNERRIELRNLADSIDGIDDIHKRFWSNPNWGEMPDEEKKIMFEEFLDYEGELADDIAQALDDILDSYEDFEDLEEDTDTEVQDNFYDKEQFGLDILNREEYKPIKEKLVPRRIDDMTFENTKQIMEYVNTFSGYGFDTKVKDLDVQTQNFVRYHNFQIDQRTNENGEVDEVLIGPPSWYNQEAFSRQATSLVGFSVFSDVEINNILKQYGY